MPPGWTTTRGTTQLKGGSIEGAAARLIAFSSIPRASYGSQPPSLRHSGAIVEKHHASC